MSGYALTLLYPEAEAPSRAELLAVVARLAPVHADARSGEIELHYPRGRERCAPRPAPIFLQVKPSEFARAPAYLREAFEYAAGFVPTREVSGYSVAHDSCDFENMAAIATRVVEAFGGYHLSRGPDADAIAIEARDLDGFFGPLIADRDYVRTHYLQVPAVRHWLVPARGNPLCCLSR